MALSIDLDPTSFGTPLEGDAPSGENLQVSEEGRAVRSALRDLREEARRMERKADEARLPHRPLGMLIATAAVAQSISGRPRPRLMVERSDLP